MNKDFKLNVYFQENGEEIEKIIALYLLDILNSEESEKKSV